MNILEIYCFKLKYCHFKEIQFQRLSSIIKSWILELKVHIIQQHCRPWLTISNVPLVLQIRLNHVKESARPFLRTYHSIYDDNRLRRVSSESFSWIFCVNAQEMHFPKSHKAKNNHKKGMCSSEGVSTLILPEKLVNLTDMPWSSVGYRSAWVIGSMGGGNQCNTACQVENVQLSATPTVLCNLSCLEHSYSYTFSTEHPVL